mmetsp:Transcript_36687/g.72606  ORF Transcript_36687/g.72606 Transcript_36687/m.72606 type:complete len:140 (-) Transcript_36687:1084-1503(-)
MENEVVDAPENKTDMHTLMLKHQRSCRYGTPCPLQNAVTLHEGGRMHCDSPLSWRGKAARKLAVMHTGIMMTPYASKIQAAQRTLRLSSGGANNRYSQGGQTLHKRAKPVAPLRLKTTPSDLVVRAMPKETSPTKTVTT